MLDSDLENPKAVLNTQMHQENGTGTCLPTIISYDPIVDSLEELTHQIQDGYMPSKQFFEEDVEDIKVYFLYKRDEMDKTRGYETPDWITGYAGKDKTIVIFSPSVFSQVTCYQDSDFPPALTHEFAHVFTEDLFKLKYPRWLAEGLSCYVAEQYKGRTAIVPKIEDFAQIHDEDGWNKTSPIIQAYSFTAYLINRFGKETMLSLLKSLSPDITFQDFTGKFAEVYKSDFESCKNDWIKNSDDAQKQTS